MRKDGALEVVVAAKPDVFNHNLETVPSRYLTVRPGARYFHSIRLLQRVKEIDPTIFTKSGIMVGLGEERHEVLQVMDDLRSAEVDFLTIGQYLQPTRKHHAVMRYVPPDEFSGYEKVAYTKGFSDGVGEPADALVASCRRRFCQVAGGARCDAALSIWRCRNSPASAGFATARRRCSIWSPMSSAIPEFVPLCKSLKIRQRTPKPDGTEIVIADMTVSFKLVREAFTSRVTLDRPNLKIMVEYLQGPFSNLENRWSFEPKSDAACDVGFFIAYEFKSRMLAMLMGTMFDAAFQRFAAAFEKRRWFVRLARCGRCAPGSHPRPGPASPGAARADRQPAGGFAARLGRRLRSARQLHQHPQGLDDGALTHRAAADGAEAAFAMQDSSVAGGDREMHEADRLARRRAARDLRCR